MLTDVLYKDLYDDLSKYFVIVKQPEPNTLRLRVHRHRHKPPSRCCAR